MKKINDEDIIALAKLNYLNYVMSIVDNESVKIARWKDVKDHYISVAKFYLTEATEEEKLIIDVAINYLNSLQKKNRTTIINKIFNKLKGYFGI